MVAPLIVAGGIAAGAGLAGNVFSAMGNARAQEDANTSNYWNARIQAGETEHLQRLGQEFGERMSSTAYQRAAVDMQKAGLNPMLAAGASESTPSGGGGSVGMANSEPVPNVPGAAFSGLASGAKDLIGLYSNYKSSMASADAASAQAKKAGVETDLMKKKGPEANLQFKFYNFFDRLLDRYNQSSAKPELRPWSDRDDREFGVPLGERLTR